MKKTIILLIAFSLIMVVNLFAQTDGNLIVEGDASIFGNTGIGIGTSTPGYKLTLQGANGDGLALLNQSGDTVTLFDTNASGDGRFTLFGRWYENNWTEYIRFVAGGSGFFRGTAVDFRGNIIGMHNGEPVTKSMFKVDPDSGYIQLGVTSGVPSSEDCAVPVPVDHLGRMAIDSTGNGTVYICVENGWRSTSLTQ